MPFVWYAEIFDVTTVVLGISLTKVDVETAVQGLGLT